MAFSLSAKAAKRLLMAGVLPIALFATSSHAQDDSQWQSGKNLYDKVCGHCHNPEVGVGPELAGRGLPEPYIKAIVRHGFRAMPAFPASYIDDQSLAQVTEYLASLPASTEQQ